MFSSFSLPDFSSFSLSSVSAPVSQLKSRLIDAVDNLSASIAAEEEKISLASQRRATDERKISPATILDSSQSLVESEIENRIFRSFEEFELSSAAAEKFEKFEFSPLWLPAARFLTEKSKSINRWRYELVPKRMTEELFWREVFFRIEKIREEFKVKSLEETIKQINKE